MIIWVGVQHLYVLPHPMFTPAHLRIYSVSEGDNEKESWNEWGMQQITFRHLAKE